MTDDEREIQIRQQQPYLLSSSAVDFLLRRLDDARAEIAEQQIEIGELASKVGPATERNGELRGQVRELEAEITRLCDTVDRVSALFGQKDLEIARLRAPQWKSIESAPRDGDDILLSRRNTATMVVACWDEGNTLSRWRTADGISYHEQWPTHWMPLAALRPRRADR